MNAPLPREERLRTAVGLRSSPALALSAWRCRSGRRYVVGVHDLSLSVAEESMPAVLAAVHRDGDGIAVIRDLYSGCEADPSLLEWFERASATDANEMHVHLFAEGAAERAAVVNDMTALDAVEAPEAA